MDSAKQQLADRLKSANNILVTVSRDPSVDQLSACLGLTLLLNKMNKHSVAVFSGEVPSTLEFLQPAETIEKTTDSLRDFIIALDKEKADKLRYKVEDNVVRIFITPYKTSISEKDLEFSQGDFNVDVVVALGVKQQEDLDGAITAHGRILHDATLASINLSPDGGLGTINWHDPQASSLSELVTDLTQAIDPNLLDNQIATALLTGIVAETKRFSNDKTTSQTMTASSILMAAGANQQLVASKLEERKPPAPQPPAAGQSGDEKPVEEQEASPDGTLSISHDQDDKQKPDQPAEPEPSNELPAPQESSETSTSESGLPPVPEPPKPPEAPEPPQAPEPPNEENSNPNMQPGAKLLTEPPSIGGPLSANMHEEGLDPATDPLSMPESEPGQLISRGPDAVPQPEPLQSNNPAPGTSIEPTPAPAYTPPPPLWNPPASSPAPTQAAPANDGSPQTLSQIEESVNSPHIGTEKLDTARDEVSKALVDGTEPTPTPIAALNATPLGDRLHGEPPPALVPQNRDALPLGSTPPESADTNPAPTPSPDSLSPSPQVNNPNQPPPYAPPLPQNVINPQTPPSAPPAL